MIINYKKTDSGTIITIKFKAKHNNTIHTVTTNEHVSVVTCDCKKYSKALSCYHTDKAKSILENAFHAMEQAEIDD